MYDSLCRCSRLRVSDSGFRGAERLARLRVFSIAVGYRILGLAPWPGLH